MLAGQAFEASASLTASPPSNRRRRKALPAGRREQQLLFMLRKDDKSRLRDAFIRIHRRLKRGIACRASADLTACVSSSVSVLRA